MGLFSIFSKSNNNKNNESTEIINKNFPNNSIGNAVVGRYSDLFNNDLQLNNSVKDYSTTWVSTCIGIRSQCVASANLYLYEKDRKGDLKEITSHPFLDNIVNKNNSYGLDWFQTMLLMSENLDVNGKAYFLIIRDLKGIPTELIPLETCNVTPVLNQNKTAIAGFKYGNTTYQKSDILEIKIPSLKNPLLKCKPTIAGLERLISINNYQDIYNEQNFKNGGRIGLSIETDKSYSESELNRITQLLKTQYSGIDNIGKPLLLTDGLRLQNESNNAKEMDFVKSSQEVRNSIFFRMQVPPVLAGVADSSNRSTANVQKAFFIQNTIKPFSRFIETPLSNFVKDNYGNSNLFVKLEYKNTISPDELNVMKLLADKGVVSGNELREVGNYGTEDRYNEPVLVSHNISSSNNDTNNNSDNTNNNNND